MADQEIDERIVSYFADRYMAPSEVTDLGPREKQEAMRVAQAAYRGNVTLGDACKAGINYVKSKR